MDSSFLEQLLHEEEGNALDFKAKQYPFEGESENAKSELLKDILAFANAWRRADAYILIGVEEVRGGRSGAVGIRRHLKDNDIQQFVNSKTNIPIDFAYLAVPFEGVQLGVIHIPHQQRPVYLRNSFGTLREKAVYVRRSSSTDVATPDEAIRMASARQQRELGASSLHIEFADLHTRTSLGTSIELAETYLQPLDKSEIPLLRSGGLYPASNREYLRELADYLGLINMLSPVGLVAHNRGSLLAESVRVEMEIDKEPGLFILDEADLPRRPESTSLMIANIPPSITNPLDRTGITVRDYGKRWHVEARLGNVQPKARGWSPEVFFIGSSSSRQLDISGVLYADNLPEPVTLPLRLTLDVTVKVMTMAHLHKEAGFDDE